jgi:hypothetical protein
MNFGRFALMSAAVSLVLLGVRGGCARAVELRSAGHPRLYFTAGELDALREGRREPVRARVWENISRSARWCAEQPPRTQWIAPQADDPQYENLYDRFYAAMHDMAIVEHLAFAATLSDPGDHEFLEPARNWLLAAARVWRSESSIEPDAGKAYAVLRVMKALAVGYDLLFEQLLPEQRVEVREAMAAVVGRYHAFFQDPQTAGPGYNKHHGSVDAAPLGIVALSMLGEHPAAAEWLDLAIEKHVRYLLPHALTPSGTNEQSSNFWASTMQYRILFLDPLRRVTGRDLLAEFPAALPGRIALAAVAASQPPDLVYNESHRSVIFGPSYGQINYWSPVLLYLARHEGRPIYQYLAMWDRSLGAIQRTRYVTPRRGEELLFAFGGYAYVWYDPSVPAEVEECLPLSFQFPEKEVDEVYLRSSYRLGDVVVGIKKGGLVVHAGGRPVLVDQLGVDDVNRPAEAVTEPMLADDGRRARYRAIGPEQAGIGEQWVELERPRRVTIRRRTDKPVCWWYAGPAERTARALVWPDGTRLEIVRGAIDSIEDDGYRDMKVHYAGMAFADPSPMSYPLVTARPEEGVLELVVERGRLDRVETGSVR